MKRQTWLAVLMAMCMIFSLLPITALASEPTSAVDSYEDLVEALATIADGGTITLAGNISGDPININPVGKTFIIDKTASRYSYPALTGSYTTNANYYTAVGYGVAGVTLTHHKTTSGNVDTFTNASIADTTIAAYVSRETTGAGSTVYACTDMSTALLRIASPNYVYLHLNQDFTGTANTTKTTAFTLIPGVFAATGTIQYSGASAYEAIMSPIEGTDHISVSFKYISITVADDVLTKKFGATEIAEAFAYANGRAGETILTVAGSVSIGEALALNSNVQLAISSGKTLTLLAPLTVNGAFSNSGTLAFRNGGKLTILSTAAIGAYTMPSVNYVQTTSVSGKYTTYGISAEANGEVALLRGFGAEPIYYGTFAEAIADTKADVVETIRLLKDVTAAQKQKIGANVDIIDLNGFTLSTAAGSYLDASGGNVTLKDSSIAQTGKVIGGSPTNGLFSLLYSGNIIFESGSFQDTGGLTVVSAYGRSPMGSDITVASGATLTGDGYGILIEKAGTNVNYSDTQVHISGQVQGGYAGIYINGNVADLPAPSINLYDGSTVSGIYAAGYGIWNIYGGTISSKTGIYVKSGEVYIYGGTISGTGAYADASYNSNGANDTGDAVIIDSCGYPGGEPSVTISGGVFASSNAYALRHVMTKGTAPANSLLVFGGDFTGARPDGAVYADGLTAFISGGKYTSTLDKELVKADYKYNGGTKYVTPVSAAASIGDTAYSSLALAVNAAKYGDTIELLSDNAAALVISKVLTIRLNGFSVGAVSAGSNYVVKSTNAQWTCSLAPTVTNIASETVEIGIGEDILQADVEKIAAVIHLTQVNGVSDALSADGMEQMIAAAGITPGAGDQVVVEINVTITATESNLEEGVLVFSAEPTANVYLNGEKQNGTPIAVSDSHLNGSAIEVLLPLPEGFAPEEILHRSADGTSERFLASTMFPKAAKKFEIVTINGQKYAKLIIAKFSSFILKEDASYAASSDAVNYYTLQEAIDAAPDGQTITLLQDCSELVKISGKSLVIERGAFGFDPSHITLGQNCTLEENGTTIIITYVSAAPLSVTISITPAGKVQVGDTVTLTATVTQAAQPAPSAPLAYQWYRNTAKSVTEGVEISGATSSAYRPSTAAAGTTYYYCVVNGIASNVVGITVTCVPLPLTYTITATAGANGSISPSGLVSVENEGSQQFTITPNDDYRIEDVQVDGVSVGAVSSYTFHDVTANHTITASFAYGGGLPQTGDAGLALLWWVLLALSGMGMIALVLMKQKIFGKR